MSEQAHEAADEDIFGPEFWDERYGSREAVWSGRPNPRLVSEAEGLRPGRALDVGCGEGADVRWLAERGWTVTGLDVSAVALARAAENLGGLPAGTLARVGWLQADLRTHDLGSDVYDLVSAQFMHLPSAVRAVAYTRLAASVRPGGTLLVVAHHPSDMEIPGLRHPVDPDMFFTAEQLLSTLDLDGWDVQTAGSPGRTAVGPDGTDVVVHDTVLRVRRPERT